MAKDSSIRAAEARRLPRRHKLDRSAPDGGRSDRISFRVHADLKSIIEEMSRRDRRTVSAWTELHLIDWLRAEYDAPVDDDGALTKPGWTPPPEKPRRR